MSGQGLRGVIAGVSGGLALLIWMIGSAIAPLRPVLWIAAFGFAIGGAVMAVVGIFASSRQRRDAIHFAERHGWAFSQVTREYSHRFRAFPFDLVGDSRQENVLRGVMNGVECASFTHVRVGKESEGLQREQAFQVALVELPVVLPRLELVPETVAHKFAKFLGGGDLDVESHEFNRRWRVLCRDPRYAHAVLDPRMVERLLQPDALELVIRIDRGAMFVWQSGRLGTDSLARRLGVLTGVARRIPEHVVREYRGRVAPAAPEILRPFPPTAPEWATTPGALTTGKATGLEPGPPATGEGWTGLPDGNGGFDIFDAMTFRWN